MKTNCTAALVTPSFHRDFERCCLLNHSFVKFVAPNVKHYIVVDNQDLELFKQLEGPRTKIVTQESIVQASFFKMPFLRDWRFSLSTLPVRGWIWQQIVKLSFANLVDVNTIFIADSDAFFASEVDLMSFVQEEAVPLFRQKSDFYRNDKPTQAWHKAAREVFGMKALKENADTGFISPLVYWRKDVLEKIYSYFSEKTGYKNAWINAVGRSVTFSEYVFYGVFVDSILGVEQSGHYYREDEPCVIHWTEEALGLQELEQLAASRTKEQFLVSINAKSFTPVPLIRKAFGFDAS